MIIDSISKRYIWYTKKTRKNPGRRINHTLGGRLPNLSFIIVPNYRKKHTKKARKTPDYANVFVHFIGGTIQKKCTKRIGICLAIDIQDILRKGTWSFLSNTVYSRNKKVCKKLSSPLTVKQLLWLRKKILILIMNIIKKVGVMTNQIIL
ncbi:hypothetical protein A4244_19065 [Bacillus badius]|nr:hypothetical protein A4244_19065 [Bacillus badius]OCS84852.1 hypothetical protein A6M11_19080 [Bacillus badius]OVE46208.1 hypothetical protein B1A98_19660 [Bacillus badius]TDV97876.1 hypothetical protein B0G66_1354 [Bacillus badius]